MAQQAAPSKAFTSTAKKSQPKTVTTEDRQIIYNIYTKHFEEDGMKKTPSAILTAAEFGVSAVTVLKIVEDVKKTGKIVSPRLKSRPDLFERLGELNKEKIISIVRSFSERGENPTIAKVYEAVQCELDMPQMSATTLMKIIRKLGVAWTDKNHYLINKSYHGH